jgi:hypothetical protein
MLEYQKEIWMYNGHTENYVAIGNREQRLFGLSGTKRPRFGGFWVLICFELPTSVQHIYLQASRSRRIPDIKPYELQEMEKDECKISFRRFPSLMSQHLDT